jgi:hypothetical protein
MNKRYQELNTYFHEKMLSFMPADPYNEDNNERSAIVKINDQWELELNINTNGSSGGISLDFQPKGFWLEENWSTKDKYHRLYINCDRIYGAQLYEGNCWNVSPGRKLENKPENWFRVVNHLVGLKNLCIAFDSLIIELI